MDLDNKELLREVFLRSRNKEHLTCRINKQVAFALRDFAKQKNISLNEAFNIVLCSAVLKLDIDSNFKFKDENES